MQQWYHPWCWLTSHVVQVTRWLFLKLCKMRPTRSLLYLWASSCLTISCLHWTDQNWMPSLAVLALLLLIQPKRLLALRAARALLARARLAVCRSQRGFSAELLPSPQPSLCVTARSSCFPGAAFLICPCILWGSWWPILPACLGPPALPSSILTSYPSLVSSANLMRVHPISYEVVKQDWSPG